MLKKDDRVELLISDMGVEGEGIGKVDGLAVFVKDAIIGDRVSVKIMKMKKNYGYGRLEKVLEPSPWRVEPRCEFHRQCGGCQLQVMDYKKQLEYKENKVRSSLMRIGGYDGEYLDEIREPICGMEEPFGYRNKAQFPVGRDKEGRIITGFYASRSHHIIANRRCALGTEENERILNLVIGFMEEYKVEPYQETEGTGLVRHILIRKGFSTGELMVCLVVNGKKLPYSQRLVERLRRVEGMTSIALNVNRKRTNVILGDEVVLLWGQPYITDQIGDIRYQISPLSFYQVNPVQTRQLYGKALEYAGLSGKETVWDLYCGIGTISLFLAKGAKQVYGVEIVPAAIEDARRNARLNGITNAEFFVGKAEEVLPAFYEAGGWGSEGASVSAAAPWSAAALGSAAVPESAAALGSAAVPESAAAGAEGMRHPDVIVVDPPRKGCDERCLETMAKMRPRRIVYVSCDSATLARDLKYLRGEGFELIRWQAVDMFPMTGGHVETVVMLSNKEQHFCI